MSTTRRRSRRHMSTKALKQEEADALKAIKEKEKQQHKRLKSIDALIKRLSPRTSRKIKSSFSKLHTAHKTKQQLRKLKKQEQQRKAKATRALNKRIKTEKLDKENAKVLKLLMEKRNLPLDVAIIIAKDRQSLQNEDKKRIKIIPKLKKELVKLRSIYTDINKEMQRVQDDIDGMRQRRVSHEWVSRYGHKYANSDGWLHITIQDSRRQLLNIQQRQQETLNNISKLEVKLKTLK